MTTITDYEKQAADFLAKTGATMIIEFSRHGKHFADDADTRDIYAVTIQRGTRIYTFDFGNSIVKSGKYIVGYKMAAGIPMREKKRFNDYKEALREAGFSVQYDIKRNENYAEPTAYNIIACLTKNDPGTFEDFCSEFGYDTDSRRAEKTYNAVKEEYRSLAAIFNDEEMTEMQEIS